jgi:hypothetical protein
MRYRPACFEKPQRSEQSGRERRLKIAFPNRKQYARYDHVKHEIHYDRILDAPREMQQYRQDQQIRRYLKMDYFFDGPKHIRFLLAQNSLHQQDRQNVLGEQSRRNTIQRLCLNRYLHYRTGKERSADDTGYRYPSKPDKPVRPPDVPHMIRDRFHLTRALTTAL